MPNCKFYAADKDFKQLLDFIYKEMRCKVFQKYSEADTDIVKFNNTAEVLDYYKLDTNDAQTAHLMLWPIDASKNVKATKQDLNPKRNAGASYRYQLEGWGLIQLVLKGESNGELECCVTNHSTEKRAQAYESDRKNDLGKVSAWNWNVVVSTSGKLNNFVKHRANTKLGSKPVMPFAEKKKLVG